MSDEKLEPDLWAIEFVCLSLIPIATSSVPHYDYAVSRNDYYHILELILASYQHTASIGTNSWQKGSAESKLIFPVFKANEEMIKLVSETY